MLGISCLVKNSHLVKELRDYVEQTAWEIMAGAVNPATGKPHTGSASIDNVFRTIRQNRLDIDAQTVGRLYDDVFGNDSRFSSSQEVEDFIGQPYIDLINAEAAVMKAKGLGRNSPITAAVTSLMNGVKIMAETNPTISRIFQDRLLKAAKRVTGYKSDKSSDKKTSEQILREVLSLERRNPLTPAGNAVLSDTMEVAEEFWNEFRKEFNEMAEILEQKGDVYNAEKIRNYADVLENATYKFLMSTAEVQQVIYDTLKEAGYSRDINTKNGVKQAVDWNKVFNDSIDFRQLISGIYGAKGFSANEVDRIVQEMEGEFNAMREAKMNATLAARNKKVTRHQKSSLQKLQNLYNIGIFNNSQQQALFRVLGVPAATQTQINQLHSLMAINSKAMQNPMHLWTPSYLRSIQREIERVIEQSEENKSGLLKIIRGFSFYSQINNSLMLANPQNVTENTLSGLVQTFFTLVFTSPRQALDSLKTGFTVWKDVVRGGVREGNERFNTFNTSANTEDLHNFEVAKTIPQKIAAIFNLLPRVLLSSMDNALKAAMVHNIAMDMAKKELIRQGLSVEEATIVLNEALHGNKQEIEDFAKQMVDGLKSMGSAIGKSGAVIKQKRFEAELAWANLETNGEFFKMVYQGLVDSGKLRPGLDISIDKNLIKSILNASEAAASKGLGHEGDSWIFSETIDKIASNIGQKVQQSRQSGRGIEKAEIVRAGFSQVNRFRAGALRWLWLQFEKISGLALIQTLITDVVLGKHIQKHGSESLSNVKVGRLNIGFWQRYDNINIGIDENDTTAVKKREEQLEYYASLKQRIIRSTIGPVLNYMTFMLVESVLKSTGDDDEDKRRVLEQATKMAEDRSYDRWMQKSLPASRYNYFKSIAWRNKYGEVERKKLKDVELAKEISPGEFFFFGYNLTQTFLSNYNQSNLTNLVDAAKMFSSDDVEKAKAKLSEGVINSMFSSPFKVFDVYMNSIKSNPLMTKKEYRKNAAEGLWEGAMKSFINRDWWENRQGIEKDRPFIWE